MKKILIITVLTAILFLAACGEKKDESMAGETSTPVSEYSEAKGETEVSKATDTSVTDIEEVAAEKAAMKLPDYSVTFPKYGEFDEDEYDMIPKQSAYFNDDIYFLETDYGPDAVFECFDYDGNLLYSFFQEYANCSYKYLHKQMEGTDITSVIVNMAYLDPLRLIIKASSAKYGELCYTITDLEGDEFGIKYLEDIDPDVLWDEIWQLYISFTAIYGDYIELTCSWGDDSYVWKYYNVRENKFYDPGTVELPPMAYPVVSEYAVDEYDTSLWKYMAGSGIPGIYLGGKADDSEWCYLDENGNVLTSFMDATQFTGSGYALVSFDRETYYFMDKNFNIYEECPFEGISASVVKIGGKCLSVKKEDGTYYAIRIEE